MTRPCYSLDTLFNVDDKKQFYTDICALIDRIEEKHENAEITVKVTDAFCSSYDTASVPTQIWELRNKLRAHQSSFRLRDYRVNHNAEEKCYDIHMHLERAGLVEISGIKRITR